MGPQHLAHKGEKARSHRRHQGQRGQPAQTPDAAKDHRLIATLLHEVLLAGKHDEDGAIIRCGEKDAGDGVEHSIAGDHPQEEESHPLGVQNGIERPAEKQQKPRYIIDVEGRNEGQQ